MGVRELNLNDWLVAGTKPLVGSQRLDGMRVENSVHAGTPDRNFCFEGYEFWIEFKASNRPVRNTTNVKVKFRPRQVPWHKIRWAAGGSCFIFLAVGTGHALKRYLIPGNRAQEMKTGMTEAELEEASIIWDGAGPVDVIVAAAHYREEND